MEAGTVLQGRYVVDRLLARGGMSEVFVGHHQALGHKLAIKRLDIETGDDVEAEKAREQFSREGILLARLHHPSIVEVIDYFSDEHGSFLVMTYVDGETLKDTILGQEGFVGLSRGLAWARDICEAVRYLHGCDPPVLYRDLKPSNIMIDRKGKLMMLDMGIAREEIAGEDTRTHLKGWASPGYASPEQMAHVKTDVRSDVYSLGATMFTIFTKERPPDGLELALNKTKVPPPSQFNPLIPSWLDAMILKMMAVQPENRYQTMDEVATELARYETSGRAGDSGGASLPRVPGGGGFRTGGTGDLSGPSSARPGARVVSLGGKTPELRPADAARKTAELPRKTADMPPAPPPPPPPPMPPPPAPLPPAPVALPQPAAPPSARKTPPMIPESGKPGGVWDRQPPDPRAGGGAIWILGTLACFVLVGVAAVMAPGGPSGFLERLALAGSAWAGGGARTLWTAVALLTVPPLLAFGGLLFTAIDRWAAPFACVLFLQISQIGAGLATAAPGSIGGAMASMWKLSAQAKLYAGRGLQVVGLLMCAWIVISMLLLALDDRRRVAAK